MESKSVKFNFGGFRHTKETAALVKQRRSKIVEMRNSGLSFEDIAKSFKLSKARVRKIYSSAISKPKSLKVAEIVRNTLRNYLPFLILKDGSFIKINYPLLFIILESKNDYFKGSNAKTYVRLIVHSSKPEMMILYNRLLSKFGDLSFAEKWIRSDKATVPNCFWKDKSTEDFILNCESLKKPSSFVAKSVCDRIEELLESSPDLTTTDQETFIGRDFANTESLLKEIKDLEEYISIVKNDSSLKREDYLVVLDAAISCITQCKGLLSSGGKEVVKTASENEDVKIVTVSQASASKPRPKAFWPKPNT